jgi:hypothetical protein
MAGGLFLALVESCAASHSQTAGYGGMRPNITLNVLETTIYLAESSLDKLVDKLWLAG